MRALLKIAAGLLVIAATDPGAPTTQAEAPKITPVWSPPSPPKRPRLTYSCDKVSGNAFRDERPEPWCITHIENAARL